MNVFLFVMGLGILKNEMVVYLISYIDIMLMILEFVGIVVFEYVDGKLFVRFFCDLIFVFLIVW